MWFAYDAFGVFGTITELVWKTPFFPGERSRKLQTHRIQGGAVTLTSLPAYFIRDYPYTANTGGRAKMEPLPAARLAQVWT
jgi:hypothetical protein